MEYRIKSFSVILQDTKATEDKISNIIKKYSFLKNIIIKLKTS
jgi:hypothetical protein